MKNKSISFLSIMLCIACILCESNANALIDREDQEIIDAATCSELIEGRADFVAAENDLSDAIASDSKTTIATNAIGVATFATFGLGFFNWNDNSDAKESLLDIHEVRVEIEAAIQKKGCKN